jgi:hypothetical protein
MDPVVAASLALGALAATGVLIIAGELLPATPALGAALRRLHDGPAPAGPTSRGRRVPRWLARRFPVPRDDLALLGYRTERYLATVLAAAGTGAVSPILVAAMLTAAGRSLPAQAAAVASVASVAAAAGFAAAAHRDVAYRARRLRAEFRHVVAVYLVLVAMERGGGHGTVEALERAGQVGDNPVMQRIRDALLRARSHHLPPWEELAELGTRIGVPELADVGQIMRGSGQSGAQVHRTLLEQAASLRDRIRTDALARAEATTGRLEIPGAVLLLVLAAFVIYPITQRIYLGM